MKTNLKNIMIEPIKNVIDTAEVASGTPTPQKFTGAVPASISQTAAGVTRPAASAGAYNLVSETDSPKTKNSDYDMTNDIIWDNHDRRRLAYEWLSRNERRARDNRKVDVQQLGSEPITRGCSFEASDILPIPAIAAPTTVPTKKTALVSRPVSKTFAASTPQEKIDTLLRSAATIKDPVLVAKLKAAAAALQELQKKTRSKAADSTMPVAKPSTPAPVVAPKVTAPVAKPSTPAPVVAPKVTAPVAKPSTPAPVVAPKVTAPVAKPSTPAPVVAPKVTAPVAKPSTPAPVVAPKVTAPVAKPSTPAPVVAPKVTAADTNDLIAKPSVSVTADLSSSSATPVATTELSGTAFPSDPQLVGPTVQAMNISTVVTAPTSSINSSTPKRKKYTRLFYFKFTDLQEATLTEEQKFEMEDEYERRMVMEQYRARIIPGSDKLLPLPVTKYEAHYGPLEMSDLARELLEDFTPEEQTQSNFPWVIPDLPAAPKLVVNSEGMVTLPDGRLEKRENIHVVDFNRRRNRFAPTMFDTLPPGAEGGHQGKPSLNWGPAPRHIYDAMNTPTREFIKEWQGKIMTQDELLVFRRDNCGLTPEETGQMYAENFAWERYINAQKMTAFLDERREELVADGLYMEEYHRRVQLIESKKASAAALAAKNKAIAAKNEATAAKNAITIAKNAKVIREAAAAKAAAKAAAAREAAKPKIHPRLQEILDHNRRVGKSTTSFISPEEIPYLVRDYQVNRTIFAMIVGYIYYHYPYTMWWTAYAILSFVVYICVTRYHKYMDWLAKDFAPVKFLSVRFSDAYQRDLHERMRARLLRKSGKKPPANKF